MFHVLFMLSIMLYIFVSYFVRPVFRSYILKLKKCKFSNYVHFICKLTRFSILEDMKIARSSI